MADVSGTGGIQPTAVKLTGDELSGATQEVEDGTRNRVARIRCAIGAVWSMYTVYSVTVRPVVHNTSELSVLVVVEDFQKVLLFGRNKVLT